MFTQLSSMLRPGDELQIRLTALPGDLLQLIVTPIGDFTQKPGLGTGLSLTGTPTEMDAELPGVLSGYTAQRVSLKEQYQASATVMEAAAAAAAAEAATAASKPKAKAADKLTPTKVRPVIGANSSTANDAGDDLGKSGTAACAKATAPAAESEPDLFGS